VTKGGAELPLTNLSVLAAVSIAGPGRLSLDSLLGIRVPRRVGLVALLATLGAVYASARREIEAGTATIADVSQEAEGGPATAAEERADVAMAAETASADDGSQGSAADVYAWTGLSGADAGTSMGSGSDLGSETPQTI
jgi:hypothetical protein